MAWAEKMTSARFFRPEELERLRITEDGILIDSPPRKRTLLRRCAGVLIVGSLLLAGHYVYQHRESIVPRVKVQFIKFFNFIESIGDDN